MIARGDCGYRVLRDDACDDGPFGLRVAARYWSAAGRELFGIRLARTVVAR